MINDRPKNGEVWVTNDGERRRVWFTNVQVHGATEAHVCYQLLGNGPSRFCTLPTEAFVADARREEG